MFNEIVNDAEITARYEGSINAAGHRKVPFIRPSLSRDRHGGAGPPPLDVHQQESLMGENQSCRSIMKRGLSGSIVTSAFDAESANTM